VRYKKIVTAENYKRELEGVKKDILEMVSIEKSLYNLGAMKRFTRKAEWWIPGALIRIEKAVPEEDFYLVILLIIPARETENKSKGLLLGYVQCVYKIEGWRVTRHFLPTPNGPDIKKTGREALEEVVNLFSQRFNLHLELDKDQ